MPKRSSTPATKTSAKPVAQSPQAKKPRPEVATAAAQRASARTSRKPIALTKESSSDNSSSEDEYDAARRSESNANFLLAQSVDQTAVRIPDDADFFMEEVSVSMAAPPSNASPAQLVVDAFPSIGMDAQHRRFRFNSVVREVRAMGAGGNCCSIIVERDSRFFRIFSYDKTVTETALTLTIGCEYILITAVATVTAIQPAFQTANCRYEIRITALDVVSELAPQPFALVMLNRFGFECRAAGDHTIKRASAPLQFLVGVMESGEQATNHTLRLHDHGPAADRGQASLLLSREAISRLRARAGKSSLSNTWWYVTGKPAFASKAFPSSVDLSAVDPENWVLVNDPRAEVISKPPAANLPPVPPRSD